MPLAREHRGDSPAPGLLESCQDAQLVIDEDIVVGRIALEDVVEFKLFVYVDQHLTLDGGKQRGASDFPGLKYHVAVRQNDRPAKLPHLINDVERNGKEPVGEWVFHEKLRNRQHIRVARILTAVALEGAQIIRVPQFRAQLFKKFPIALLP